MNPRRDKDEEILHTYLEPARVVPRDRDREALTASDDRLLSLLHARVLYSLLFALLVSFVLVWFGLVL